MTSLFLGFAVSAVLTLIVIRSAHRHARFSADTSSGPQKFHARSVPRIGGIGIVCGLLACAVLALHESPDLALPGWMLLACAVPAFGAGLVEDLTKRVSPRRRLAATALSAGLAVWLLGSVIDRTAIPGLDWVVSFGLGAALVTMFTVAGVANAVNIVDGFNGLASMCVALMLTALAYVAIQVGDRFIALWAIAAVGAVIGFFIWNFPGGLIFLGDGGAYFLGFWFAELAILLLHRNPQVSPMFPLLICIYPVFETVFTMYRRKVLQNMSPGLPDGIHLHSLIYRRVMRWAVGNRSAKELTRRNSLTSPYLWALCLFSLVPAVLFWDNTGVLAGFIVLFGVTYSSLYWRIVRFKSPRWLVVRRR
ncbi:MraY family glycosyltransferase [Aquabacterium sp. J223]|uniref:MraY family glycosyltransferase n=1 Tax=Aquabacterium sp. J223 TaxID=2898431 RepID=UPI0021AE09BC|nr:glycosyltransferase [Aquabacterium sp. J223]UUX97803.1 glycosyltransferase [Aquabacterium sp. J223]